MSCNQCEREEGHSLICPERRRSLSAVDEMVFAIIDDLKGRRGLRHEWENIDDDIQEEIFETWKNIIEEHL